MMHDTCVNYHALFGSNNLGKKKFYRVTLLAGLIGIFDGFSLGFSFENFAMLSKIAIGNGWKNLMTIS